MEKRAHERFVLWFPVKINTLSAGRTSAIVCDASDGGVLIDETQKLKVGEVVTISFEVSGEGEKSFLGHIVRIEQPADKGGNGHRVAIEFVRAVPELEKLFTRAAITFPPPCAMRS